MLQSILHLIPFFLNCYYESLERLWTDFAFVFGGEVTITAQNRLFFAICCLDSNEVTKL
jgi:hypothetical protein